MDDNLVPSERSPDAAPQELLFAATLPAPMSMRRGTSASARLKPERPIIPREQLHNDHPMVLLATGHPPAPCLLFLDPPHAHRQWIKSSRVDVSDRDQPMISGLRNSGRLQWPRARPQTYWSRR